METGHKFQRLTAIKFDKKVNGNNYWLFQCECGNIKSIRTTQITQHRTSSCGCLRKESYKRNCLTKRK